MGEKRYVPTEVLTRAPKSKNSRSLRQKIGGTILAGTVVGTFVGLGVADRINDYRDAAAQAKHNRPSNTKSVPATKESVTDHSEDSSVTHEIEFSRLIKNLKDLDRKKDKPANKKTAAREILLDLFILTKNDWRLIPESIKDILRKILTIEEMREIQNEAIREMATTKPV